MEIYKEEGNNADKQTWALPEAFRKRNRWNSFAKHPQTYTRLKKCYRWSLQLTLQVLHFSSFLPIYNKLKPNFYHGNCKTYQFFMTTNTLKKKINFIIWVLPTVCHHFIAKVQFRNTHSSTQPSHLRCLEKHLLRSHCRNNSQLQQSCTQHHQLADSDRYMSTVK